MILEVLHLFVNFGVGDPALPLCAQSIKAGEDFHLL